MPIKKELVYPFFLECFQYLDDVFWENIFEDLAYGIAPYGTYISKDFLCCAYKNKEFSYKIERKPPDILYEEIYKLLKEKLGILSQKEKVKKKTNFYEIEKNIKESRNQWSNIRKKNIKDILYEKYVIDMKEKHNLSIKQAKYLLSVILLSVMFKIISSKDISFEDGKIQHIEGIEFENGEVIVKKSLCSHNIKNIENQNNEMSDTLLSENWIKYLKFLSENSK
jgi:hypothetical protein